MRNKIIIGIALLLVVVVCGWICYSYGIKTGVDKGIEEGKKIGRQESYKQGYNAGKINGGKYEKTIGDLRIKILTALQNPALFATNDKFYDSVIPTIYICNETLNEYESVKLVVNYKSPGGGYKKRISKLEAGSYQYAGIGRFFNERGEKFPSGNVVVSLKFVGYRNGEKVEFEGLVFNP